MGVGQKNGTLIQGFKYGYIKNPLKKGELAVDEELRDCIETIYNLYEQGQGMRQICRILNTQYNFPTPSEVIRNSIIAKGKKCNKKVKNIWDMYMVSRILQDDLYIGTLRTHKAELKTIKGNAVKIPLEKQYIFENHHEPIISKEQFDRVQEIIKKRHKQTSMYKKGKNEYIFGGFIVCGDCGYGGTGVNIKRNNHELKVYECSTYRKYGTSRCCTHRIREQYMLDNFKEFLKQIRAEYKDLLNEINFKEIENKSQNNKKKLQDDLNKTKSEYKALQVEKIKQISVNKNSQELITETYEEIEKELLDKIKKIETNLTKVNNESISKKKNNIKKAIDYFDEIINAEKPDKAILMQVLDKIVIYKDKSIQFKLKISIDKLI